MLATGLLALYQLTAEGTWLASATELLDIALAHFADPQRPGRWYDTADDAEELMLRPADPLDGATPSGASTITEALLTAAHGGRGSQAGGTGANGTRVQQAQVYRANLPFTRCMHRHGIPEFPDSWGGGINIGRMQSLGIDTNAPQFSAALKACHF